MRITELPWKTATDLSFDKSVVPSLKSDLKDILDLSKIKESIDVEKIKAVTRAAAPDGMVPLRLNDVNFPEDDAGVFHRFIDKLLRRHVEPRIDTDGMDLGGPLTGNYFSDWKDAP